VIILDTHIWVWWVHGDAHLPDHYHRYLEIHEAQGLGVSAISCWEVAKLVEYGRLTCHVRWPIGSIKPSPILAFAGLTSHRGS